MVENPSLSGYSCRLCFPDTRIIQLGEDKLLLYLCSIGERRLRLNMAPSQATSGCSSNRLYITSVHGLWVGLDPQRRTRAVLAAKGSNRSRWYSQHLTHPTKG